MTELIEKDSSRPPCHPGEILKDIFDDLDYTKKEIAQSLMVSRQHLHGVLEGKRPVTADFAARLGKFLGNGPGLWLRIQAAYDTWHALQNIDVSHIPTLDVASVH
ncbi:HigA family addiction module antitoxin [Bartonella sp. DGB2]|uniref:HigA family addiction module antitoxin n=1 Tax=Bartonella sp. DGB2 TaxID=3388426 RepID=UPI00398FEC16